MTLRMKRGRGLAALALVAIALAGCSGFPGTDKSSTMNAAPQVMTASVIRSTLAGKSWRFQGPNNTGTTLYADDGTSLVEVDGKGKTKGKWMTKDGQLCESFDPSPPWLPGGVPMSCYPFARGATPNTYQAGKAVFSPAA
jgi:hypothetical protein